MMSGGVDSSITAHLLRQAGWEVLGITMKIPVSCDTTGRGCCGVDAAFVCDQLKIPHYFIDVTTAFQQLIIEPFRQSYANGETPNPCADCNTFLKFSRVWDMLTDTFEITYLATGHYAQVVPTDEGTGLRRAVDKTKDQSYFLYGISAERLDKLVLPLGSLSKTEVRKIASELGLSVADKPESMELCFSGEGDYRLALDTSQSDQSGDILDIDGNRIGTHQGIANYTLGQRRGIGYAGGKPLYVCRVDAAANTIVLGTREQVSFDTIAADQINVLIPARFTPAARLFGKIRSYSEPEPCTLLELSDDEITVEFDTPQFAPCPGQKLVLYDAEDNIVAGGVITSLRHRD